MLRHARGLIVLLILGLMIAGYILIFEGSDSTSGSSKNFINKPKGFFTNCSKVEVKSGSLSVTIEKEDGKWMIKSPLVYPADKSVVKNIIDEVDLAVPDRKIPKKDVTEKALQSYELQVPKFTIKLYSDREEAITANFGSAASFPKDYIFASVEGSGDVYVISGNIKKYLSEKPEDYRSRMPFDLSVTDISLVSLKGRWNYDLVHKGKAWELANPFASLVDTLAAERVCGKLTDLRIDSFVDDKPADFSMYGLDAPSPTIRLVTDDGKEHLLHVGAKVDTTLTPGVDPLSCYAKFDTINNVFAISEKMLNDITQDPLDLVSPKITSMSYTEFSTITVKNPRGEFEITMKDNELKFVKPMENDADGDAMDEFIKQLGAYTAHQFEVISDPAAMGFDGTCVFEINADKVDLSHVKLEFGRPDPETGMRPVRRNDEGVALLFDTSLLDSIASLSMQQFRDRTINRFDAPDVVFASIVSENGSFSFSKREGVWSCDNKPESKVDEQKLNALIDDWDSFKAVDTMFHDPLQDKALGFETPRVKLVFTSEKKENDKVTRKTTTIIFGSNWEKGDKKGVHAYIEGDDFVFIAPNSLYSKFTEKLLVAPDKPEDIGPPPPATQTPAGEAN